MTVASIFSNSGVKFEDQRMSAEVRVKKNWKEWERIVVSLSWLILRLKEISR